MIRMQLLHASAALMFAASTYAQFPQFPGMPGGQPTIILPGIGGQVDCKMLLELMSQSGIPPQMKAMLSAMGCAPGGAVTPPPSPPSAPQPPAAQVRERCEMVTDFTRPLPQIWLGPMQVISARDLEGSRLAPLNQQLVDGLRFFGEGRLEQSAAAFQAVVQQTPDPALRLRALTELAKTQLAARRTADARTTIEQGLTLTAATSAARPAPGRFAGMDERMRQTMEQANREEAERDRAVMRAELLILMGIAFEQDNDLGGAIARYHEANALTRSSHEKSPDMPFSDPMSDIAKPYLAAALLRAGQAPQARALLLSMLEGRE